MKRSVAVTVAKAQMLRTSDILTDQQPAAILESRILSLISSSIERLPNLENVKNQWISSYPMQCIQWTEWQKLLKQSISQITYDLERNVKKSKEKEHKSKHKDKDGKKDKHRHKEKHSE